LLGSAWFAGLEFHVNDAVLVPRSPIAELILEHFQPWAGNLAIHRVLDLCTGSGCIALAIAKEFPDADVYGTDVSKEALAYARRNAKINGITNARFLQGPLFEPVQGRKFDIIAANPPYIRRDELDALQREIRDWEPVDALHGGEDGMDFYRQILSSAGEYLVTGGFIFLELGYDQAGVVLKLAQEQGFKEVAVINDYDGIGRILRARI